MIVHGFNWTIGLKDIKKTIFNSNMHLHELSHNHTWSWTLSFTWSNFSI